MPGILPMKVIKMGNASQGRIAQACDRCRSKKIRCDGVRPCCTQCKTVGFECQTSDKLSRRAFPRGYTESLEVRVRSLEGEVRELKNLLDERDEKIDVLSRIHSFNSPHQKTPSPHSPPSSTSAAEPRGSSQPLTLGEPTPASSSATEPDTIITLQKFPNSESHVPFAGRSSVRAFSSALTAKLQTQGVPSSAFSTKALTAFPAKTCQPKAPTQESPPRLVSDQLVNIYFQEWAPLYPVIHRPSILKALDLYLADPTLLKGQPLTIIQLNLIFGIAALSSKSRTNQDPAFFENKWCTQLDAFSGDMSVPVVQCMVLAQMYCMVKGDYKSLIRYRALAVGAIQCLGLDQSQKHLALDPLVTETRKKVFWCQYILDRFTAAVTGMSVMLRDDHINVEMPADIDDENISQTGFHRDLPNEPTRMSGTLALLDVAKIMGKAVETLYPSAANSEISLTKLHELSEELDAWKKNLPTHLQLVFAQDKPSTNVTGSRSPILSLVYYFVRILIHRPAACFGSHDVMCPAMLTVCDASKHIVQILELLDERSLSLSLAINRLELVYLTGLGILWQIMSLKRDSKLGKEGRKLISSVKVQLGPESAAAALEYGVLSNIIINGTHSPLPVVAQNVANSSQSRVNGSDNVKVETPSRRNTISGYTTQKRPVQYQQQTGSHDHLVDGIGLTDTSYTLNKQKSFDYSADAAGLDYRAYDADVVRSMSTTDVSKMALSASEWECILSDLDHGSLNIFNGIYGGQECAGQTSPYSLTNISSSHLHSSSSSPHVPVMQQPVQPTRNDASSEVWSASSSSDFSRAQENVLNYPSEDGIVCGTDHPASTKDYAFLQSLQMVDSVKGIMMPSTEEDYVDLGLFDGWDCSLFT